MVVLDRVKSCLEGERSCSFDIITVKLKLRLNMSYLVLNIKLLLKLV